MKKLPIAVIVPHAGLTVPPEVADVVSLTAVQIFNEADAYVDQLFDFREQVQHWLTFPFARAILDVNRPDDPALTRPGDGVVKWQTSYGTAVYPPHLRPNSALERQLVAAYWQPWHDQLAAIAADPQIKLVIDAHSMAAVGPSKYDDPGVLRPRVSVSNLGNALGTASGDRPLSAPSALTWRFARLLAEAFAPLPELAPTGVPVAVNTPFFGGWDMLAHGPTARQPWVMIEVNRGLYVGAQDGDTPIVPPNEEQITAVRAALWQAIERLEISD
ncbi:MAG: N-formylglutamate amidohydrolase [Anaerolineales bacterium]|nr:N-formylglutamate amidohydrolase [Anaerolineales bacterium]MCB8991094.1 N-formylglutamate amidohydrolase [Ardenticatenaceae bacterium]MCB9004136.1 N-formylglutamate amidohydrolase [Ardenticatenaceae bacterium]